MIFAEHDTYEIDLTLPLVIVALLVSTAAAGWLIFRVTAPPRK